MQPIIFSLDQSYLLEVYKKLHNSTRLFGTALQTLWALKNKPGGFKIIGPALKTLETSPVVVRAGELALLEDDEASQAEIEAAVPQVMKSLIKGYCGSSNYNLDARLPSLKLQDLQVPTKRAEINGLVVEQMEARKKEQKRQKAEKEKKAEEDKKAEEEKKAKAARSRAAAEARKQRKQQEAEEAEEQEEEAEEEDEEEEEEGEAEEEEAPRHRRGRRLSIGAPVDTGKYDAHPSVSRTPPKPKSPSDDIISVLADAERDPTPLPEDSPEAAESAAGQASPQPVAVQVQPPPPDSRTHLQQVLHDMPAKVLPGSELEGFRYSVGLRWDGPQLFRPAGPKDPCFALVEYMPRSHAAVGLEIKNAATHRAMMVCWLKNHPAGAPSFKSAFLPFIYGVDMLEGAYGPDKQQVSFETCFTQEFVFGKPLSVIFDPTHAFNQLPLQHIKHGTETTNARHLTQEEFEALSDDEMKEVDTRPADFAVQVLGALFRGQQVDRTTAMDIGLSKRLHLAHLVARGVEVIHQRDVVHRSIRLDHVMLTHTELVKQLATQKQLPHRAQVQPSASGAEGSGSGAEGAAAQAGAAAISAPPRWVVTLDGDKLPRPYTNQVDFQGPAHSPLTGTTAEKKAIKAVGRAVLIGLHYACISGTVTHAPQPPATCAPPMNPSHPEYWFQCLPAAPAAADASAQAAPAGNAGQDLTIFAHLCRRGTAAALLQRKQTALDPGPVAMDVNAADAPPAALSFAVLHDLLHPGPALLTSTTFDMMGLALTIMSIIMCTSLSLADASTVAGEGLKHFRCYLIHVSASTASKRSQQASQRRT